MSAPIVICGCGVIAEAYVGEGGRNTAEVDVTIADLDGDGRRDVLACDTLANRIGWLQRAPSGEFVETTIPQEVPVAESSDSSSPPPTITLYQPTFSRIYRVEEEEVDHMEGEVDQEEKLQDSISLTPITTS